jgi:methyl coenzyme M reductase gamma subunit
MLRNVVDEDIDHEFIEREVLDSSTEIRVRTIHVDPLILSFDTMMVEALRSSVMSSAAFNPRYSSTFENEDDIFVDRL